MKNFYTLLFLKSLLCIPVTKVTKAYFVSWLIYDRSMRQKWQVYVTKNSCLIIKFEQNQLKENSRVTRWLSIKRRVQLVSQLWFLSHTSLMSNSLSLVKHLSDWWDKNHNCLPWCTTYYSNYCICPCIVRTLIFLYQKT